jgi:hypothetical protein
MSERRLEMKYDESARTERRLQAFRARRSLGFIVVVLAGVSGLTVASASVASASQHKVAAVHKTKHKKSDKKHGSLGATSKCNESALGRALKPAMAGSSYTVNSIGCSTNTQWAYAIVTSGGTQQVDVLEYSSSIGVWVPDNTTLVCSKKQVPKDILAETCKSNLSQIQ